jgi:hypothetical protein
MQSQRDVKPNQQSPFQQRGLLLLGAKADGIYSRTESELKKLFIQTT